MEFLLPNPTPLALFKKILIKFNFESTSTFQAIPISCPPRALNGKFNKQTGMKF